MTDPNESRKTKCYYPKLGEVDKKVNPAVISETYLKYTYDSVSLYFSIRFGDELAMNATMWGQLNPGKFLESHVDKITRLFDILCNMTTKLGDKQIDVNNNGSYTPAQVIFAGPIPGEDENAAPVGMMFQLVLQAYNRVHFPSVEDQVDDEIKKEKRRHRNGVNVDEYGRLFNQYDEDDDESISVKQRLAKIAKEKNRRGPDVLAELACELYKNTYPDVVNNNNKKKTLSKKQQLQTQIYSFSGMLISEFNELCSYYSGRLIDRDQAHATFISQRPKRDGTENSSELSSTDIQNGNPCHPAEIFSLDIHIKRCKAMKAHPFYCDPNNYTRENVHGVYFPFNGKYIYRLRYTDTRPAHGFKDMENGGRKHHGIMDTYFPHIPKPNMENDPSVEAYNRANGYPIGQVDPVCHQVFTSYTESDIYECDNILKAQMQKKFAAINKLYDNNNDSDPTGRSKFEAMRKAQKDGLDVLFSYYHLKGNLSESHKAVLGWFDNYLDSNKGIAHFPLPKTTKDIDWFGFKMSSYNESFDRMFQVRTLHKHMIICLLSAFNVVSLNDPFQINPLFAGEHGIGKSWVFMAIKKLLIEGTVVMTTSKSDKADTDGTNRFSDRVEIQDEMDTDWMGGVSEGKDYDTSSRTSRTKSNLTTGESTRSRLTYNETAGTYITVEFVTKLCIAYFIAFNGSPQKKLDHGMQDRLLIHNIMKEQSDDFREKRALESDNQDIDFLEWVEKTTNRFRHNQALVMLAGRCIVAGIFPVKIDLVVCMDEFHKNEKQMSAENSGLSPLGSRLKMKYRSFCRILILLNAVSIVFESEASNQKGQPFSRYSLLELQQHLVGDVYIATFALRLLQEQIEPRLVTEILSSMNDIFFHIDEEEDEKEEQDMDSGAFLNNVDENEFKHIEQPQTNSVVLVTGNKGGYVQKSKGTYQDMVTGKCAIICPDDSFYIERAYPGDKIYAQPHLRQYGIATAILTTRLASLGITVEDIEAVLRDLVKRKYKDEINKTEKPGLMYRTESIRIARSVFKGLNKGDKLLTYLNHSIDTKDLIPAYNGHMILGSMDPQHKAHLHLYTFENENNSAASKKKKHRIEINTSFASPGTIALLASCAGENYKGGKTMSSAVRVFDQDPLVVHDSSLYEKRILLLRVAIGFTYPVLQSGITIPFTYKDFNTYLDAVSKNSLEFTYRQQFLNEDKCLSTLTAMFDIDNPTVKWTDIQDLPEMSTSLTRCISETSRDASDSTQQIDHLRKQMSQKESSNLLRKRLRDPDPDPDLNPKPAMDFRSFVTFQNRPKPITTTTTRPRFITALSSLPPVIVSPSEDATIEYCTTSSSSSSSSDSDNCILAE